MPSYPYISGQAAIVQTFLQLRKGFPNKVDAGYLQRFNIAPANESYVISILRFLGLIDDDGNRIQDKTDYFFGNDDSFKSGLEDTLRSAYSNVFDEMNDGAFDASKGELAHWFRASDKTSELVGQRQASTFQTLAALAGHGALPAVRSSGARKAAAATPGGSAKKISANKTPPEIQVHEPGEDDGGSDEGDDNDGDKNRTGIGLTVRIEVNLPPGGDADTYDVIFASIKKHLMS